MTSVTRLTLRRGIACAVAAAMACAPLAASAQRDRGDRDRERPEHSGPPQVAPRGDGGGRPSMPPPADRSRGERGTPGAPGAPGPQPERSPGWDRGADRGTPGRWYDGAHGHNHYYPAPGTVYRAPPSHSRWVVWGGVNYRYLDGIWWGPGARGYVVVRPPYGVVVSDLPTFATVITIAGIAYLYANGVYYREHPGGGYEVAAPPVPEGNPVASGPDRMYVYPRNGQSAQQQASDEYECHRWAVSQTNFDPTALATGNTVSTTDAARRSDYQRARTACLEGRGYTVR